jgi:hypothetical protein
LIAWQARGWCTAIAAAVVLIANVLLPAAAADVTVTSNADVIPPGWIHVQRRVEIGGGAPAIDVQIALAPDHAGQQSRYESAAVLGLARCSEWFGPGPPDGLTMVDAPWNGALHHDNLSTRVLVDSRWLAPERASEPERSILVAIADRWWTPVFAARDRSLARALALYTASRILALEYPNTSYVDRFFGGHVPMVFRAIPLTQADHVGPAGDAAADIARWLLTAEAYFGWPTLQAVLSSYVRAHRNAPGSADDLQQLFEDTTGRDLGWFFDEIASRRTVDFAVRAITVERAGSGEGPPWRTVVSIARIGEGLFPGTSRARRGFVTAPGAVHIEIEFADGERVRETWDGRDATWAKTYIGAARPVAVMVDPDHVLVVEKRRVNNSWTAHPDGGLVSLAWSGRWMVWLQDYLLGFAALV